MGYELLVTRRADVGEPGSGRGIERAEFERVVLGDAAFARDEELGEGYAVVRAGAEEGEWVQWREDGNLLSKNPSEGMIRRLVGLARLLDAKVIGEDGEEYGEDGKARAGDGEGVGAGAGWGPLMFVLVALAVGAFIAWKIWAGANPPP